jgi:hypothetical protein
MQPIAFSGGRKEIVPLVREASPRNNLLRGQLKLSKFVPDKFVEHLFRNGRGSHPLVNATLAIRFANGVPKGIRTPVTAVKGRCPGPLDDGDFLCACRT